LDDCAHHASANLDSEREWGDIDEEDVLCLFSCLTTEDTSLDSGTICDGLIWVNSLVGIFAIEVVLEQALDLWDTG